MNTPKNSAVVEVRVKNPQRAQVELHMPSADEFIREDHLARPSGYPDNPNQSQMSSPPTIRKMLVRGP
jgi:hypothetical protein